MGTSLRQLQAPRAQKQPSKGQKRLVGMVGGEVLGSQSALSPLASSSPTATPVSPLYHYTWEEAEWRQRPGDQSFCLHSGLGQCAAFSPGLLH